MAMAKVAVACVAVVLALAAGAAAQSSGCCSPRFVPQVQFGFSITQAGLGPGMWRSVNMVMSVDYERQIAVQAMNNFTYEVVTYTQGAEGRTMVYIPEYNMCVNGTYNYQALQYKQLCVGPGTEFDKYGHSTIIGGSLVSESWGNMNYDSIMYNNVNINGCHIVAVSNVTDFTNSLGIFYNVTTQFDDSVFDIPAACDPSRAFDASHHNPRVLREVTEILGAANQAGSVARAPYGMPDVDGEAKLKRA